MFLYFHIYLTKIIKCKQKLIEKIQIFHNIIFMRVFDLMKNLVYVLKDKENV